MDRENLDEGRKERWDLAAREACIKHHGLVRAHLHRHRSQKGKWLCTKYDKQLISQTYLEKNIEKIKM